MSDYSSPEYLFGHGGDQMSDDWPEAETLRSPSDTKKWRKFALGKIKRELTQLSTGLRRINTKLNSIKSKSDTTITDYDRLLGYWVGFMHQVDGAHRLFLRVGKGY